MSVEPNPANFDRRLKVRCQSFTQDFTSPAPDQKKYFPAISSYARAKSFTLNSGRGMSTGTPVFDE
jgi:hypothetical protein